MRVGGVGVECVGEDGLSIRAVGLRALVPPGCEWCFAFAADGAGGSVGWEEVPAFDAVHGALVLY